MSQRWAWSCDHLSCEELPLPEAPPSRLRQKHTMRRPCRRWCCSMWLSYGMELAVKERGMLGLHGGQSNLSADAAAAAEISRVPTAV